MKLLITLSIINCILYLCILVNGHKNHRQRPGPNKQPNMCSHQGHSSSSFQKACHPEMIPVLLALTSLRLFVIFKQCLSRYSLCSISLCVKIENEQLKQKNIEPQSATIEAKNSVIKLQGDRELSACKGDKCVICC